MLLPVMVWVKMKVLVNSESDSDSDDDEEYSDWPYFLVHDDGSEYIAPDEIKIKIEKKDNKTKEKAEISTEEERGVDEEVDSKKMDTKVGGGVVGGGEVADGGVKRTEDTDSSIAEPSMATSTTSTLSAPSTPSTPTTLTP